MAFYNPPHPHTLHAAMSLPRLAPGIVPALMAWMLYGLITFVIQSSSGISYLDWFRTAANAWRTGVLSLAVGSVVLLGWLAITRWDHLWRDPRRLTLLDIYLAAGGTPREPHRCLLDPSICPGRACALGHLVERENNRLHHTMQKTTLARLARTFDRNQLESP